MRGFTLCELTPGGKRDEEHVAFVGEADAAAFSFNPLPDGCLYGVIYIPSELYDVRISLPPGIDQRLKFFLQAVIKSIHGFQGTNGSAISEGEFRYFAFLTEVAIDSVLLYGDPNIWDAEAQ